MSHLIRTVAVSSITVFACAATLAQSEPDSADVSGALAAIQAKQTSANTSTQPQQAFPALKAQSCKEAVAYVESPSGLAGRWDAEMGKYTAYRNGLPQIQKIKDDLQSDAWRTSDWINDVHTYCKLTEDVLASMTPGGKAIKMATDVSVDFGTAVSERAVHVYDLLEKGESVQDALNSSIDELAVIGFKEGAKNAGYGQIVAGIDILDDVASHIKTAQEAADSRLLVQERVQQLDQQINEFANKMSEARENLLAVEALKDAVIAACNSGQPIQTVPEFANGYVEPQPTSTLQPGIPQPATGLPWWATLSSIHPVISAGRPIQGKTGQAQPVTQPSHCSTSTDLVGPGPKPPPCP